MAFDPHLKTPSGKLRARALGVPFLGEPGTNNAITDVPGVTVGYHTLIAGSDVRTGVTAILPRGREGVSTPVAAGFHSFNGNGEVTGAAWINEAGQFNSPVMITNTHAVGPIHRGVIDWVVKHKRETMTEWLLPVVAETWDGYLNDINGSYVTQEMAGLAIDAAHSGAIEEGSVGGGTGMNCYAFKGGNGTASRRVNYGGKDYTVGVFLQCNFGARHELMVAGHPLGLQLLADNPYADYYSREGDGSCIGVLATDAPFLPGQLQALARRLMLGLARTGTTGSHFSGDIFLAFSAANEMAFGTGYPKGKQPPISTLDFVPWAEINPFYAAAVYAAEEAVINAMVANETMTGRDGHRSPHLPHDAVRKLFKI